MSNALVINGNFEEYVATIKAKSEDLIRTIFPQKITQLNTLLESETFDFEEQRRAIDHPLLQVPSTPNNDGTGQAMVPVNSSRALLSSGPITCNGVIRTQIDIVKPFIRELVEHANLLKMWVTFLIPKIEDGNNFGVSIQEEILMEIMVTEKEADSFLHSIQNYHLNRAQAIGKIMKYPNVNDFRKVVTELDEKEFVTLRMVLTEIRNRYATMYDMIGKNWEKVMRPRSSNAENMY